MNNSSIPSLSNELFNGNLIDALDKASHTQGKRLYMTDKGVQALSAEEVKTSGQAELIRIPRLDRVLNENAKKLQPETADTITKALSVFVKYLGLPHKLNERELKNTAEIEGFGYKKANLDQINTLCKEGFGSYQIKVPTYVGIPSTAVQNLIKARNLDISLEWKKIIDNHFPTDASKREVFNSKKFPDLFLADCAQLRNKIADVLKPLIDDEKEGINLDQLFSTKGIDHLIETMKSQKERLMVRSTGKEDTKELANAGGNTTVPNVAPTKVDVLNSLLDVVVSYMGEKSLKQRLGAGDLSLFDPSPFTPVLIQRMIGERTPTALPKCGVMFTEDSESAITDKNGRTARSGITVIQSAYGHNEAVVSSLIPVDSYYVNENNQIFPIIRPKTHRMIPTDKSGELQMTANLSEIAKTSSLSLNALTTLKNFSERLEQFYDGPMDVEFVVDENEQTIYIVQARPLVHNKGDIAASYITDVGKLGEVEVLKGSSIGTAGGGIRLAKPSQLIIAPTLSHALDLYQDCDDPLAIEGVVVGKMAPSTSHWATSFRTEKKPVLYLDQWDLMQSWTDDADSQILMSPQQGIVVKIKANKPLQIEELEKNGVIAKGWIDYPAAPLFSIYPDFKPKKKLTEEVIRSLCPALCDPKNWEVFKNHANHFPLQKIFTRLRHSHGENPQLDLAVLLYQFKSSLERHSEILNLDSNQKERIEILQGYALALAESINENSAYEEHDPNYCRKLLPLHFLHALIYAQTSTDEVIDGHSLTTTALNEMREEQKLVQELLKENITLKNPYSLTLLRFEHLALTPEIATLYRTLVLTLDREGRNDLLKTIAALLIKLNNLDLLFAWFNIILPTHPDPQQLAALYERQAPLFEELAKKRKIANALNISAFGYAKSFSIQWQVLNSELLNDMKNRSFAESYKKADASGKLAAVSLMNKVVNQFDLSIKALESSDHAEKKKLELFQTMLQGYCGLALNWLNGFCPPEEQKNIGLRLLEAQKVINKSTLSSADLNFSKYFDVRAFGSLSGASLGRMMYPKTLEDAFSIIHQELLTMLSILNQNASETAIPMPPLLKNTILELKLGMPTGTDLSSNSLCLHFTRPLREHGVQYTLKYHPGSDCATLKVRFSAQNENQRWDKIAHEVVALKMYGKFDVIDMDLNSRGLEFTFRLDKNDNLKSLSVVLNTLEMASTQIAQPTINNSEKDLKELKTIENAKKQLPKANSYQKIVQEMEKSCGLQSAMMSRYVIASLRGLVKKDPEFVESFLKRRWKLEDANISRELDVVLPLELMQSGHAITTICERSIQLINSKYSENLDDAIELLRTVAEKEVTLLPKDCIQYAFKILLNRELVLSDSEIASLFEKTPHENALIILDLLMNRGESSDAIQEGLITLLSIKEDAMQENALKVIDLIVKHQQHYPALIKKFINPQ